MTSRLHVVVAITFMSCATAATAAPQPIEAFARRPQMQGVTISADGRFVAFLSGADDDTVLMTYDRTTGSAFKRVTASQPNKYDIGWCRWANEQRLVCGLYGNIRGKKYAEPPFKRLFAINADGTALKILVEPRNEANLLATTTSMRNLNMNQGAAVENNTDSDWAQGGMGDATGSSVALNYVAPFNAGRQDEILDITPDDRDTVLIQVDDDHDSFPSIFQLNIYTAGRSLRQNETPLIQEYLTDGHGNPRIGRGVSRDLETNYFARLDDERDWRRLGPTKAVGMPASFRLIAMAPAPNAAYAFGSFHGRDALWSIDLTDKRPPDLLFQHPLVDMGEPILRTDRQLIGVRYDVERPYVWYADPKMRDVLDKLERQYPERVHEIVDISQDGKTFVIQSSSDTEGGSFSLFNTEENKLQRLGVAYPELNQGSLGKMTNILYKAADGTEIPGYLTVPSGAERKNLPLIVMPHDGPLARDSWKFSFLRTFLANRGYAVLQMNYRGSAGFGEKWRLEENKDWAGLTYSDIQDGTNWAVSEGIADPKRICILGWGFGGYEALLSAARNNTLYRCAVGIGAIVDLEIQRDNAVVIGNTKVRKEIVADREKRERNSPLKSAGRINIPVLLVHGTKDWQVQMDHSKAMADELEDHQKPHKLVLIKNAGHDLERKSDRVTLLKEIEEFLAQNLK